MNFKIPPLTLTCIFLVIMSIFSWLMPQFIFDIPKNIVFSILIAIIAAIFSVMGVVSFRRVNTTVNPNKPDQASSLVVEGVYRLSRNPMYLGFLLFLIAWGFFLQHLLSLLLIPAIFITYMNVYQIRSEEKALHIKFGEQFTNYKNSVRRWI